jgi:hypothetical protein
MAIAFFFPKKKRIEKHLDWVASELQKSIKNKERVETVLKSSATWAT